MELSFSSNRGLQMVACLQWSITDNQVENIWMVCCFATRDDNFVDENIRQGMFSLSLGHAFCDWCCWSTFVIQGFHMLYEM